MFPIPAASQATCADHATVVGVLTKKYGETLVFSGLADKQYVFELYWSRQTGTWTVVMALPTGIACLINKGEAGAVIQAVAKGRPA